jgi:hypothetical protein
MAQDNEYVQKLIARHEIGRLRTAVTSPRI